MRITICGAGNAAQTLTALLASDHRNDVVVYAPLGNEAAQLASALDASGISADFAGRGVRSGRPHLVTADPEAAGSAADYVLLALPSFAHESVLTALAPSLAPDARIGALPARGGFDWLVRAVLPEHRGIVFGLQTLPWACRIQEWGRRVQVLGVKAQVDVAAWSAEESALIAAEVSALIEVPLRPISGFLALTLANTGQILHPGIMFGRLQDWDGQPFAADAVPLFYAGVDERTAQVLQEMSDEIQSLCRALEQRLPGLDLSSVAPLRKWLLDAYPSQIADASSLRTALNSNSAYAGIRFPVEAAGGDGWSPSFSNRYLSEDVPFGLLVTRGIAELADVTTPTIARVIGWAQARIGREYLVDGCVAGRDLPTTRAPQRFGINALSDLLHGSMARPKAATGASHDEGNRR